MRVVKIECDNCQARFNTPAEALDHEMVDDDMDLCGDSYGMVEETI